MNAAPVIVLGVPDAAVHRLAAMLGRHPQAQPLPELGLCLADRVDELLSIAAIADDGVTDGLLRAIAFLFGPGQTDAGIRFAEEWLQRRQDWTTGQMLDALVERAQPRAVVLAETRIGWRPLWLDKIIASQSRVAGPPRFIHLLRHPRVQCELLTERLRRENFVPPDYKDFGAADWPRLDPQLAWFRINRNIDQALSILPPSRHCRVLQEHLQADSEQQLRSIMQWLDWSSESSRGCGVLEQLLHPEAGAFSAYGPTAAPGGGDPAFFRDPSFYGRPRPRLSLNGLLSWRQDIGGFADEVVALAQQFGYR